MFSGLRSPVFLLIGVVVPVSDPFALHQVLAFEPAPRFVAADGPVFGAGPLGDGLRRFGAVASRRPRGRRDR